jgi:hypothetical protein
MEKLWSLAARLAAIQARKLMARGVASKLKGKLKGGGKKVLRAAAQHAPKIAADIAISTALGAATGGHGSKSEASKEEKPKTTDHDSESEHKKVNKRANDLRARIAVLRKEFDPSQPRDESGRWTTSVSSGFSDMGAGGSRPYVSGHSPIDNGGAAYGSDRPGSRFYGNDDSTKPAKERPWSELSQNERRTRMGDYLMHYSDLADPSKNPDAASRAAAAEKLQRLAVMQNDRANPQRFEDSARAWHENALMRSNAAVRTTEAATLTQQGQEQRTSQQQASSGLDLHEIPPDEFRRRVASMSQQTKAAATVAKDILDTLGDVTDVDRATSHPIARAIEVTGALVTIAATVNGLSRAKNASTAGILLRGTVKGIKTLRSELPALVSASKVASGALKGRLTTLASVGTKTLSNFSRSHWGTTLAQIGAQALFSATGGSKVTRSSGNPYQNYSLSPKPIVRRTLKRAPMSKLLTVKKSEVTDSLAESEQLVAKQMARVA